MINKLTLTLFTTLIMCISALSSIAGMNENENEISIQEGVICQDVVNRIPIGAGDIFPSDIPKLYCYTKVIGAQSPTSITHMWYQNGMLQAKVQLPVKSSSWRTWSSLEISPRKRGEWMVEIVSENGVALESIIFVIK